MAKPKRRRFSPDEKAAILRRHLADVSVADLSDEYKLQPSVFYLWQRQFLDQLPRPCSHSDQR